MIRRIALAFLLAVPLAAGRAEAVTVRDIIELTKAGVSEQVLLALIEVDRGVFTLDAATMKELKQAGVTDTVLLAMIHSGRTPAATSAPEPPPQPQPVAPTAAADSEPRVIVIDHHDQAPPQQVPVVVPVATIVPGFGVPTAGFGVPTAGFGVNTFGGFGVNTVNTFGFQTNGIIRNVTVPTMDGGAVKVNLPVPTNCVKADPVYWGFGGKLRPGSWQPPPQVLCR